MEYYSDQIKGHQPRNNDSISPAVWGGIVTTINSLIATGAFGKHFPETCPDGAGVYATDEASFKLALKAEVSDIDYPFVTEKETIESWRSRREPYAPGHLAILDLIQFCYEHVAKPIQSSYHSFFNHHHLTFDVEAGREEFRIKINRIFERNKISYELQTNGNFVRIAPEILGEALTSVRFQTQDQILNQMLEDARTKFLSPNESVRRESLERLWDAWERIKTVLNPSDKKVSARMLLDNCADEPNFRQLLEDEAFLLTKVGNNFLIRHSEVGKVEIGRNSQVDYLFHRLFSLIFLAIKNMPK